MTKLPKILRAWDFSRNKVRYVYRDAEGRTQIGEDEFQWFFYVFKKDFNKHKVMFERMSNQNIIRRWSHGETYTKIFVDRSHASELLNRDNEFVWEYQDRSLNYILKALNENGIKHFEADLKVYQRWIISNEVEYETDYRILHLDIETDDSNIKGQPIPGEFRILSCAFRDGNTGQKAWICLEEETDEAEEKFIKQILMIINSYDVITGWNSNSFDLMYIRSRATRYGLRIVDWRKKFLQDHLRVWDKLGPKGQSLSLDYVAKSVLKGRGKIQHTEKIFQMYRNNRKLLEEYNVEDVDLLYEIEKKTGFLAAAREVNAMGKCPCDDMFITRKIDMMLLEQAYKDDTYHFKTKEWKSADEQTHQQYAGAYVFEPIPGLYKGAKVLDFACLIEGTKIESKIGPVDIKDIKVGDTLQGIGNYESKVIQYDKKQHSGDVIEIELQTGQIITTTPEHKFPVLIAGKEFKQSKFSVIESREIKKGDFLLVPNTILQLSKDSHERLLYELLGVYLCEGSYYEEYRKHQSKPCMITASQCWITIVKFEDDFKERISLLLDNAIQNYGFPAHFIWEHKKKNTQDIQGSWRLKFIQNKTGYSHFLKNVIEWFKTKIEKLQTPEFLNNFESMWGFIDGVLESDGSVNKVRHSIVLNTTEKFRNDLYQKILPRLGLNYTYSIFTPKNYPHKYNIRYIYEFIERRTLNQINQNKKFHALYKCEAFERVLNRRNSMKSCDYVYGPDNAIRIRTITIKSYSGVIYSIGMENQSLPFYIANGIITKNSLYPSIIDTYNISPDTLITEENEVEIRDNRIIIAPNNQRYRKDFIGLIPKVIRRMADRRKHFKNLMKTVSADSPEYKTYDKLQYVFKYFGLSFYGAMGEQNSRFFDIRIAESVTLGGQFVLKSVAEFVTKTFGYKVIYGDTDSLFMPIPDTCNIDEIIKAIEVHCNEFTKKAGCDKSSLIMAYDKGFSKFVITGKKRYAGNAIWLEKPVKDILYVAGMEFKRTDVCLLVKKKQEEFLKLILGDRDVPVEEVRKFIEEIKRYIFSKEVQLSDIMLGQKLTKSVEDYSTETMHLKVVEEMKQDGKEVWVGDKIQYFIKDVDPSTGKPVPCPEYKFAGKFAAIYYWNNKIWPAFERIVEVAYPNVKWENYHMKINQKKISGMGRMDLW